jgi:hypothetical protein
LLTWQFNRAGHGETPEADEFLVACARRVAGGGRIHGVEQLIGAYRMYAEVLRRRPGDRQAQEGFYRTEAAIRAGLRVNPTAGAKSLDQWRSAVPF